MEPADIVKPTDIPNLQLITSGPLPANPIELLTSEKMDKLVAFLKRSFDFVLVRYTAALGRFRRSGHGAYGRRDHSRRQGRADADTCYQAS